MLEAEDLGPPAGVDNLIWRASWLPELICGKCRRCIRDSLSAASGGCRLGPKEGDVKRSCGASFSSLGPVSLEEAIAPFHDENFSPGPAIWYCIPLRLFLQQMKGR
jgi:hypothetical protein